MGNLGDLSPQGSVAVGVLVGLISASLQAIGLTLQRKSHILEDEKHPYDVRRPPYKRRRWQLGMLMFVVSNVVGSTIQITTLPLPVLSTLQASGLVFNTIFATLILGEAFTRYSVIGTLLVCIGAVLIAVFGAIGEPAHTLDQLLELLQRRPFILWMAGTALVAVMIFVGSKVLKSFTSSRSKHSSIRGSYTPRLQMHQSRVRLIRGLCYGLISGILSAHTLLLAKSSVELLVRTIVDRVNQFNRWQSWVILITMVTVALMQLFYLNRGLKLCSTSVLYPFVFCTYNIIAILDGLIYFQQMSRLTNLHAGLVALGTVVLLGGVLCLSWRLEVIDAHTAVGPSQATVGPGMAAVEEHAPSPLRLELEDEESQRGEREPLLHKAPLPHRSPHQRTPSLPLQSSMLKRQSTSSNMDPASIWAELDDSDSEYADADVRSALLTRFNVDPLRTRPRSKSSVLRGPHHLSASPATQQTWSPRRVPLPVREGERLRRTSLPTSNSQILLPKRRTFGPVSSNREFSSIGYGTLNGPSDPVSSLSGHSQEFQRTSTDSSVTGGTRRFLAGSRNTLGAWRTGLQYLARLAGRGGRRNQPRDTEANPPTDSHTEA